MENLRLFLEGTHWKEVCALEVAWETTTMMDWVERQERCHSARNVPAVAIIPQHVYRSHAPFT